ncbi:hypothetical protein LXL04_027724 [Taraxacum kok-saghyz]
MEQRCLKLDHKIASQQFIISSLKSQLYRLDSTYNDQIQQLRVLKNELENLEELDKENDKYYVLKAREIDDIRVRTEIFATDFQMRVEELMNCMNEVRPLYHAGYSNYSELAEAEIRKSELVATKESLDRRMAYNYNTRAQFSKTAKEFADFTKTMEENI